MTRSFSKRQNYPPLASFLDRSEGARSYRYPLEKAASVAIETVSSFVTDHPGGFDEVRFVHFSPKDLAVYESILSRNGSK